MARTPRRMPALLLACALAGCGDSAPTTPTAEEKSPDFGAKSGEKMKEMIGVPSAKGMQKPAPGK